MTALNKTGRALMTAVFLLMIIMSGGASVHAGELAEYSIPVTCKISPDIPVDLDIDFTYTLRANDSSCPMPEGSDGDEKTVHMTDSGSVDFGKIRFDHPDVFRYTLAETTAESGAFRRDPTEYSASLIADTDGNVRIVVNTDKGRKPDKIEFVNSYMRPVKTGNGKTPMTGDYSEVWQYLLFLLAGAAGLITAVEISRHSGGGRGRSVLIAMMLAVLWSCEGQAYAAVDSASDYTELPVNSVEISSLDFSSAEFTSFNSAIKKGTMQYHISGQDLNNQTIYWTSTTAPSFGTSNATETQNAKLAYTSISGDLFTLRFRDAAILSDGTKKDVLMTFSDLYFGLSKNVNGTTGSRYYYPVIRITDSGSGRYTNSGIGTGTTNAKRIKGIRSATRIKTVVRIVEPGTDQGIDGLTYILGFRDLDVRDHTTATGDNIDRYAGRFSEGIGLISGYEEPVYLTADTHIVQQTVDGVTKLRGSQGEDGGMQGGFDIPVSSSGFTYYWYGSQSIATNSSSPGGAVGTAFGYSPKVNVFASAGNGGTIEKEGVTVYLVNAATSYSYTPSAGYKVKNVLVDGQEVPFDRDGGTYVFSKLTESGTDGYDHTIEVTFHKPQDILIIKKVNGSLGDAGKEFDFEVSLSGMEKSTEFRITDDSTGQFYDIGDGTRLTSKKYRTSSAGRAVLKIKLKGDQFIRLKDITGGARYSVLEKKSDHIASYKLTGDGDDPSIADSSGSNSTAGQLATRTETVDEDDGLVSVVFINQRDLAVPTGVRSKQEPIAVLAAMIVLVGIIASLIGMINRPTK